MGSMWLDTHEDTRVYPGPSGADVPNFDPGQIIGTVVHYPNDRWGADFISLQVMMDFMETDWRSTVVIPDPPAVDSQEVRLALETLVGYQQTKRAAAMPEILAQNTEFQPFFCAQLGVYPRVYPTTYLMLKLASRLGELVMVYLKQWHAYPRPTQLYPRLTPPIPVAPHASYPSGHALIGHMMAYTLGDIIDQLGDAAGRLAGRIALNREYAGVHFPFDTQRGIEAAAMVMNVYRNLDVYQLNIEAARKEWDPNR